MQLVLEGRLPTEARFATIGAGVPSFAKFGVYHATGRDVKRQDVTGRWSRSVAALEL